MGEDPNQLPNGVSGTASFDVTGDLLTVEITSTTSDAQPNSGWVLSGLLFDVSNAAMGMLVPVSASSSNLLNADSSVTPGPIDTSDFVAAAEGVSGFGEVFDWGIGTAGEVDGLPDAGDRF